MENDEPIVQLSVVCDSQPEPCAAMQAPLLKGLPFAKAKTP